MTRLLEARALSRRFAGVLAVDGVDLHVDRGEILGVIGPNGAGKSTTFNMLAGALPPTQGEVFIEGRRVTGMPPHAMARLGLLRTFQHNMPFAGLTVRDNVMVGTTRLERSPPLLAFLGARSARAEESGFADKAGRILAMLGLSALAEEPVDRLSFGQGRLLEIGRALAADPSIILLDEPAAGLTPAETAALATTIRSISAAGVAILLVEHDMNFLLPLADRVVVLDRGRKIADGSSAEIRDNAAVRAAYLGTRHDAAH